MEVVFYPPVTADDPAKSVGSKRGRAEIVVLFHLGLAAALGLAFDHADGVHLN
jgi:hypothetical protein